VLKFVLIAVLIGLLFSSRNYLGGLLGALKASPKKMREGKAQAEDPARFAKPVNAPDDRAS
jgi:hypothetical protein